MKRDVRSVIILSSIAFFGVVLRVLMIRDAFWVDEILSWIYAKNAQTLLDIFQTPEDNNHFIYTTFLFLLGDQPQWILYRLPSLVFGLLSIGIAGVVARRFGGGASLMSMLLFASSTLMVIHSTQARGYSLALFLGLLAYELTVRYSLHGQWTTSLIFWCVSTLGFLSHLTFLLIFFALLPWMLWHCRQCRTREILLFTQWYGIPLLLLFILYKILYSPMTFALHPDITLLEAMVQNMTWPLGLPPTQAFATASLLFFALSCTVGLSSLKKEHPADFLFYLSLLCFAFFLPFITIVDRFWGIRFALVAIAFLYILLGKTLSNLMTTGRAGKTLATAFLVIFVFSNTVQTLRVVTEGRSVFPTVLATILDTTQGADVSLGSNQPLALIESQFYVMRETPGKTITFVNMTGRKDLHRFLLNVPTINVQEHGVPEWYLSFQTPKSLTKPLLPPPQQIHLRENTYILKRIFQPWNDTQVYRLSLYHRT